MIMFDIFIKLANRLVKAFPDYFSSLKEHIMKAGMNEIFEVYIAKMLLYSFSVFLALFISSLLLFIQLLHLPLAAAFLGSFLAGTVGFFVTTLFFHLIPFEIVNEKATVIETNLPFAINHMAAIATAGVSPYIMFKIVSEIKEYKELAKQLKKIVRDVDTFGMDITTAIEEVSKRSPSSELAKFLHGINSTIEGGGDLVEYLKMFAERSMKTYQMKRKKYLALLETYADFYTALLVAAPLFVVSLLAVLSMMSENGTVMGFPIETLMQAAVYVFIPLMNIAFLLFLEATQPEV